jgi:DNA processing protein
VCYPKENNKLYEKVLERGAMVSEFPIGSQPAPENFRPGTASSPDADWRHHCEGKRYRRPLITARLAMEFGTEVFGVPDNENSGCKLCAEPTP